MQNISFSTTSYKGFEKEILQILNLTRVPPKSKEYLQWRYEGQKVPQEPFICWAHDNSGQKIGMISVIFRKFYINNKPELLAIGGDLSIDPHHSGKGIAKGLVNYMTKELVNRGIYFSCGIANPASRKIHSYAGWKSQEYFIRHIFILNPEDRLFRYLKIAKLSKILGVIYKRVNLIKINRMRTKKITIQPVSEIDDDFHTLWKTMNKTSYIMGDKDIESITWRYKDHPNLDFSILKFYDRQFFTGYIIYTLINNGKICKVYDLLGLDEDHLPMIIHSFIEKMGEFSSLHYIWIALNENHPYSDILSRLGFIKRKTDTVLHAFNHGNSMIDTSNGWFLGTGDKDI